MVARRSFLGLLMGAPLAAPAAVLGASTSAAVGYAGEVGNQIVQSDPLQEAFSVIRNRAERRHHEKMRSTCELPYHIAGKKSWSPAFKHHVFDQEREAFESQFGWSIQHTPEMMRRIIKATGEGGG